jgi:hypothetical protein
VLKRLALFFLAAAAGWLAYRRVRPASEAAQFELPAPPDTTQTSYLPETYAPAATPAPAEQFVVPATDTGEAAEALEAYCVRCKTRRPIQDMHIETTESGRRAAKGSCPVCGAKLNRFLPAASAW